MLRPTLARSRIDTFGISARKYYWPVVALSAKLGGSDTLMILRLPALVVALWLLTGNSPVHAQTQQDPSGPAPQPPAANPAQPTDVAKLAKDESPQKPEAKPRKVITNDDIEGKGEAMYPTSGGVIDLSRINDCDRYCFDQVRQASRVAAGSSPSWKHALLEGIDKVSNDTAWQSILLQMARIKGKYCSLEADKNADLARHSRPGTVTEGELSIEEAYERKFRALQQETAAMYERAEPVRAKYSGMIVQFMTIQQQRIINVTCPVAQRPTYYQPANDPPDDPEDP
jgi:hypothetical protein